MDFLKNEAFYNLADPDSAWNYLFWNTARNKDKIPSASPGVSCFGPKLTSCSLSATFQKPNSILNWYPGNETTIRFLNGTSLTYKTHAVIDTEAWSEEVVDGESFLQHYCVKPTSRSDEPPPTSSGQQKATPKSTTHEKATTTPIFKHPTAVVQDPYEMVAGYYLDGVGYDDVAVLWLAQFFSQHSPAAPPDAQITGFRETVKEFLRNSVAEGKKRLILDVSGNIGGISHLPYDMVS